MDKKQTQHVYGLANNFATELVQRAMNGDIGIREAMVAVAKTPTMMMYRTLPEEVIDNTLNKHDELILRLGEVLNDYVKEKPMEVHEFIVIVSTALDIFLSETF